MYHDIGGVVERALDAEHVTHAQFARITRQGPGPGHVYARWHGSHITGRAYGEMFAWVIGPQAHDHLDRATARALQHYENGDTGRLLGWEVYRIAVGLPVNLHAAETTHAVQWDDASDDFDYPHDYDTWARLNPHLA